MLFSFFFFSSSSHPWISLAGWIKKAVQRRSVNRQAIHPFNQGKWLRANIDSFARTKARQGAPSFALMTFVNWPFVVKQRLRGLWQTINRSLQTPTKQSAMAAREQCRWHTMTWSNVHVDSRRKPEKECLKVRKRKNTCERIIHTGKRNLILFEHFSRCGDR